jgi:hypothetical protein
MTKKIILSEELDDVRLKHRLAPHGNGAPGVTKRIFCFLTGVVLPTVCLVIVWLQPEAALPDTPWQSGHLSAYVAMLLRFPSIVPFLVFIAYSMISMSVWCFRPDAATSRIIRFGIYSGVILAVQFHIYVVVTSLILTHLAAVLAGPVLLAFSQLLKVGSTRIRRFSLAQLMGWFTIAALLVVPFQFLDDDVSHIWPLAVVLFIFVAATPTLNMITYFVVARDMSRVAESPTPWQFQLGARLGWIVAWLAGWVFAVERMLVEYSKLPASNSNCYVANAAAHGHARLVGAQRMMIGERVVWVNPQMRRLKFVELALRALSPSLHRRLRLVYDFVGPRLARVCRSNRWFADATYLALKPVEWAAVLFGRWLGIHPDLIDRLYATLAEQPPPE